MENKVFKQKQLKPSIETGSFINMLMSSNSSIPEVGKGATVLLWTDRHAYEVMSVSKDFKTVVIQQYLPERIDDLGMSESQDYKYEKLNGYDETIVWKWGAWRKVYNKIIFEDSYEFDRKDEKELFDEDGIIQLVEGKTKAKTEYSKVNIVFGIKEEYYDFSF
ncbi:MAG: hypothetical protein LBN74_08220 [Prevotella sp.]|jgi:hypothetical protein|nr:hypothetical protein [Prevotella sp.]